MTSLKTLSKIYLKNPILNSVFLFVFLTCLSVYIAAVVLKVTTDNDNDTEAMKLLLVSVNILGFILISFGRHINLYKVFRLKVVLIVLYIALTVGVVLNYVNLGLRFRNPDETKAPLGFNEDLLTLAMTLLSDTMFLMVYIYFSSKKALISIVVLIVLEIVIFGVSFALNADDLIDLANLTASMFTLALSITFWTGETIIESPRNRFRHFYEDVDMHALTHADANKSSKSLGEV
ncbi:hypothetical protein BGZ99_005012 [Dissophora globulifera]|uniref:Uncharacterized protein n=1 Tax=Dissophora globulifera TaxID=979702 RepID=A0A9P6RH66_9FUNG|nr:hypothetical protein BGZ99_005012 [Dissophora globulifera]